MSAKLTYQSKIFHGDEEVKDDVVDILTRDDIRTSIFAPKQEGRIISESIGINSVCQGQPIKLGIPGIYERGFHDPNKQDIQYFIDAENKIITCLPKKINLFYDQDKVNDKWRYIWNGTFEEFLDEFKKAGYDFVDKEEKWKIQTKYP